MKLKSTDKVGVHRAVALLYAQGVRDVVCSPGSRNAPIVLALRAFPDMRIKVVVDERTAAFVALGMAMQSAFPVALCCTSGSAVANYYPAVTEAFYQKIPLVLLTADRPLDRIDQREGQSIRQTGLFARHILSECSVDEYKRDVDEGLAESLQLCVERRGPIHWNFPLHEPLYGTAEYALQSVSRDSKPFSPQHSIDWERLKEKWSRAEKILLIVGQEYRAEQAEKLNAALKVFLQAFPQVGLFYESLSNLNEQRGVPCIDRLILSLSDAERETLRPDLVISMGGEWVTRKVKIWLKENKSLEHWHIDAFDHPDILECLDEAIHSDPLTFINLGLEELDRRDANYQDELVRANERRSARAEIYLKDLKWCDLRLFARLQQSLPEQMHLFNGNSSVVRYVQLFEWSAATFHLGNRGVSGIDGVTSTATGYAHHLQETCILITGDLAFFYDSNAFWQAKLPSNLKVLVVNNGGGSIFRIIEGPSKSGYLEEHFEAAHQRQAKDVAKAYDLPYFSAVDESGLNKALPEWLSSNSTAIMEVFTPREINDSALKNYFKALQHG